MYQTFTRKKWKLCTLLGLVGLFLFTTIPIYSQTSPCCAQRWTDGGSWNADGSINDAPNAPSPNGIIRCGSSAGTQSNISTTCTYQAADFNINLDMVSCLDPDDGTSVSVTNPSEGADIIWLNFDVRPFAGTYEFQLNDGNNNDNIGWALFYSNNPTSSVGSNGLSGNCSSLTYIDCGIGFTGWANYTTPTFSSPTNLYLGIWNQDGDNWGGRLNNFKARFGCGDNPDIVICALEAETETTTCNDNGTYTVSIPITGANGDFMGFDATANISSSAVCLNNIGVDPAVLTGVIEMVYPVGTDYNITISPNMPPTGSCANPENPSECMATISGTAPNCIVDNCPDDPNKTEPGICGCGTPDTDSDGDGTPDCNDNCPSDPNKTELGSCGCGIADTDSDGDGTPDCNDNCPSDPNKTELGSCGCGIADTDSDGDGTPDCNDACDDTVDSDGDGTPNCSDNCPNDPNKTELGICGCGIADTDSDGDGTPDCNDNCPSDPNKTELGSCGCGIADTDSDGRRYTRLQR